MQDFNEQNAPKICQWAEIPPYPHCGAVLRQGISHEFCCKPFAGRIRNHLPHPMGRELLNHIVELTQSIANCPGILNCGLRPILQHPYSLSAYRREAPIGGCLYKKPLKLFLLWQRFL
jgi:hypothetical protein